MGMKYVSRVLVGAVLVFTMFGTAFAAVTDEAIKAWVTSNEEALFADWTELVLIPGKSRKEQQRGEWIKKKFEEVGLNDVKMDDYGNVYGMMKGNPGTETIVIGAHMDTVFDLNAEELKAFYKVEDGWLNCPGSGDDTPANVALIWLKKGMDALGITPTANIVFLSTVQEEIGLYGMKYYLNNVEKKPDMLIAVDGGLGNLAAGGMGINWYKVYARTPARHTNRSWGFPSAMKSMALAITEAYKYHEKDNPTPTLRLNLGVIGGGTVENAVAEEVWVTLDMRCQDPDRLKAMEDEVFQGMQKAIEDSGATYEREVVMEISAGQVPGVENHKLVKTMQDTLQALGLESEVTYSGSTDGNVAMAMGIPAVSIGVQTSENGHAFEERTKIDTFYVGVRQLLMLMERLK